MNIVKSFYSLFILFLFPVMLIAQHHSSISLDILFPHRINPAFRLEKDTFEIKYLHVFEPENSNTIMHDHQAGTLGADYFFDKIDTQIGIEVGITRFNLDGLVQYKSLDIHITEIAAFANRELFSGFFIGTEIMFEHLKSQRTDSLNQISNYSEQHVSFVSGISYLPRNFILGLQYHFSEEENFLAFSAGYRLHLGEFDLMVLDQFCSVSLMYDRNIFYGKMSYKEKIDGSVYFLTQFSSVVGDSETSFGFSAGIRLLESKLALGIGVNGLNGIGLLTNVNTYYTPYLRYTFR